MIVEANFFNSTDKSFLSEYKKLFNSNKINVGTFVATFDDNFNLTIDFGKNENFMKFMGSDDIQRAIMSSVRESVARKNKEIEDAKKVESEKKKLDDEIVNAKKQLKDLEDKKKALGEIKTGVQIKVKDGKVERKELSSEEIDALFEASLNSFFKDPTPFLLGKKNRFGWLI